MTITVTGVNDAPVAVDDSGDDGRGFAVLTVTAAMGVLDNDTDPDTGDMLVVSAVSTA